MTNATAQTLRAELAQLQAAKPATVAAFAESRATRIREITQALASADIEVERDSKLEAMLKSTDGDQFDRQYRTRRT